MKKWEEISLSELLEIPMRNGLTKPKAVRGSGFKMVGMSEIFQYSKLYDVQMDRVPLTEKEKISSFLEEGDLLFARQSLTLAGAGKCIIVKELSEPTVCESHIIRVRLNAELVESEYVYYYLNSYNGRKKIESIVEQVAAAGIRGSDLLRIKIPCPSLAEQRAIVKCLTLLDDKIELNNKINDNLVA